MFKKKYYKIFGGKLTERDKEILASYEFKEFKDVLKKLFEKKIDENIDCIIHSKGMNDEMRGKYLGVALVYEDLLEYFTKIEKKENKGYEDIMK